MTWTQSSSVQFNFNGTVNVTTNGKTLACSINPNTASTTVSLSDALTITGSINVSAGTFTTNNFNVTAASLTSSNTVARTINLGSSTVTLSLASGVVNFATQTNLTFNAGTSTINLSSAGAILTIGTGVTFHNVSWTSASITTAAIQGANTFNNLSVAGRTSAGIAALRIDANQTINGTLTLSAGTNATARTFLRSNTIGETRTLTCAAVASLTDIDFRDITIAGAAAPVSGTRLGDCKGNSGITFPAAKTVYYRQTGISSWGVTGNGSWSLTLGGSAENAAFPLAQDTAVFPSATYPSSGSQVTVNANYNIGTIDMSARTSNTMTLATVSQTPTIYGNWINGTGTTLTGTGVMTFAGRGSQTITSAGRTFTQGLFFNNPSGAVTLQDAFSSSSTPNALQPAFGTFDANGYNVTLTGAASTVLTNTTNARTVAIGSGTWTIAGTGGWNASTSTNLTVTGTGTISLTSASAKTFAGGGIQTYPTLNQGGTGTLTVTGSNKFAGLTNTAIGRIQFTGGTTNEFTSFTISGALGNLLQLGSTNTTQAILQKPTAWNMGVLSMDMGNNTGLNFLSNDGTMEYLSVSYINGTVVSSGISVFISESVTANSTESSIGTFNPTIAELIAGSDSAASSAVLFGAVSETSSLSDVISSSDLRQFFAAISEAATSSDVVSAAFSIAGSIAEALNISESAAAALSLNSLVSESAVVSDETSRAMLFTGSVAELVSAAETALAASGFNAELTETATSLDASEVLASTFSASATETVFAQDLLDAPGSIYSVGVVESVLGLDFTFGAYLWNDIPDDDETYSKISDTPATWSPIADNSETWNPLS